LRGTYSAACAGRGARRPDVGTRHRWQQARQVISNGLSRAPGVGRNWRRHGEGWRPPPSDGALRALVSEEVGGGAEAGTPPISGGGCRSGRWPGRSRRPCRATYRSTRTPGAPRGLLHPPPHGGGARRSPWPCQEPDGQARAAWRIRGGAGSHHPVHRAVGGHQAVPRLRRDASRRDRGHRHGHGRRRAPGDRVQDGPALRPARHAGHDADDAARHGPPQARRGGGGAQHREQRRPGGRPGVGRQDQDARAAGAGEHGDEPAGVSPPRKTAVR
jgi:hypothetical protein